MANEVAARNCPDELDEDAVREIRRLYADGQHTHRSLAARFGVAKSLVARVIAGTSWSHIG